MGKILSKNSFLIIWFIMLLKLLTMKSSIEYMVILVAGVTVLVNIKSFKLSLFQLRVVKCFLAFLVILLLGFFLNPTMVALRAVIGVMAVLVFVIYGTSFCIISNIFLCNVSFLAVCLFLISHYSINGSFWFESGNTFAGHLLFIYILLVSMMLLDCKRTKREFWIFCLLEYVMVAYLIYVSNARTALLVLLGITFLCPIAMSLRKVVDLIGANLLFILLFGGLLVVLIMYANISSFSWYDSINDISVSLFGKHLDSSRGYLWKTQLERLSDFKWIFGLGTGVLPDLARYANASFHNAYLQTLVQNGMVGLLGMLSTLFVFWNELGKFVKYKRVAIYLAFFIGIAIYNCFEVTLFANKISIGLIEWMILTIGIKYIIQVFESDSGKESL